MVIATTEGGRLHFRSRSQLPPWFITGFPFVRLQALPSTSIHTHAIESAVPARHLDIVYARVLLCYYTDHLPEACVQAKAAVDYCQSLR